MKVWKPFVAVIGAFLVWTSVVISVTIPTASSLTLTRPGDGNSVNNLSIPNTPIDPRFRIIGNPGSNTPLDLGSLLMTGTNELAKLALKDWEGEVPSFRSAFIPRYSDVAIVMKAVRPASHIDTKIAVWGLFSALNQMATTGRCLGQNYDLYWGMTRVAVLVIKPKLDLTIAMPSEEGRNESNTLNTTLPTLSDNVSFLQQAPISTSVRIGKQTISPRDHSFSTRCRWPPGARPIPILFAFSIILNGLRLVASEPKTSLVDQDFSVQSTDNPARAFFAGPYGEPISIPGDRTYPYELVILTLRAMMNFLVVNHRYTEMAVDLVVDGVSVGSGGLAI
ncbi:hypothetical protein ACLMJK_001347 [Lecanora helva]